MFSFVFNTKIQALVFFLAVFPRFLQAQNNPEYSLQTHSGFIIYHQSNVGHLAQSFPVGITASFYRQNIGAKAWAKAYKYPFSGVSLQYLDYNNSVLGKSLALFPNMRLPIRPRKQSNLEVKLGTGIAYHFNPFDLQENPKNIMFSSQVGFGMLLGMSYRYQVHQNWHISANLEVTHFSNGAFSLPNAGVNVPNISLALHYQPNAHKIVLQDSLRPFVRKTQIHIAFSNSLVERYPGQDYKHYVFHLTAYGQKQISTKSALQLGLDYSVNTALKSLMRDRLWDNPTQEMTDYTRLALVLGHELKAGKVALLTQYGIYLYAPFNFEDRPTFQRYGVKYYFHKNLFGQFSFKSHRAVAECIEFALGVYF